ncbi:putative Zn-dependent protease [Candidatus Rhodobacter oscarellae]|uniref:Putative Zn-dependent protease n=1 Tax=Candidatus Rhodobacter oscarellae TaxID=1675527 RepID=A0A0J9E3M2_9RHOB|nr:M48 family metalloprotease [Candidatus Rhodobacter lobularis]KMW56424.1 putative Zn-dependent protease [Candidatus Rhodobacter lobularis]
MAGIFRAHSLVSIKILLIAAVLMASALPGRAVTILRDPDIEHALRQLALPLINAAGLSTNIRVLVVRDPKLNAFVVDTKHIFIHSGLIQKVKTAEELQAVFAHELAHIANGHLTRRLANRRAASGAARFGLLLALAVGAGTGNAEAAAGIATGSASSASRVFLGHTRAEESSADQAALRYMAQKGINPKAMADVLDYFRGQEVLNAARQDPYIRSHPLTRDRMRAVHGYAAAYKNAAKPNPEAQYWFARAKGKLSAFLNAPSFTLRKVKKKDGSDIAVMRRAIAYHRKPDTKRAIAEINKLAAMRPNDPYVHELRGQILLESRNYAAAAQAYQKAVSLAPRNALILAGHGRALVALNTRSSNAQALKVLVAARARDARDPRMMRDLATAYARAGNNGMASLITAERYAITGNLKTAAVHAKRAAGLLPQGSAGWNRAQDVLGAAKRAG